VTVYDAVEPSMTHHNRDPTLYGVHARDLTYPDGPHDAEALMIDPVSNQTIIVTKEPAGTSGVYGRTRATPGPLTLLTKLDLGVGELVTAGDISADGRVIVLRTYGRVHVWSRDAHESLADAFARPPCEAPAPSEPQGEAIALEPDGRGYVTSSEGAAPALFEVRAPGP
jgi:hypothetical protein